VLKKGLNSTKSPQKEEEKICGVNWEKFWGGGVGAPFLEKTPKHFFFVAGKDFQGEKGRTPFPAGVLLFLFITNPPPP
ncbi:hypothetical protein, partial [Enterococcus faecalis]|uniref:hypothetical protein n=1 Tax=Enterococcus faecalis TaxID=1351 RepID=UPI00403F82CA